MRILMTLFALLVALAGVSARQSPQSPYVGRWNITGTGADTDKIYWLEVRQDAAGLSGLFLNRTAHATPLAWIREENGELVFQYGAEQPGGAPVKANGPIYRAHLEGGKLIGEHTLVTGGAPARGADAKAPVLPRTERIVHWIGVRAPIWPASNANGQHTYGAPVTLVGPQATLDVWGVQVPSRPMGWTIENGVLTNSDSANNLVSKQKFQDFKVDAEFKLAADSNSGIYLRGRYELQLIVGSGPAETQGKQGLLAIYGWKAPDVEAGKPVGEWQTLEAVVVGNHVTATLNGQRVHNNAVLPAITGGALDADELAPGPIMIQGDHKLVWFRKLVVTPITKD